MSAIRRPVPELTKKHQWTASDPALSVWVSAHAGSGKTHVLSQRVVRLLLARVPPSRILCLTYTKAAAANMAARVFKILAEWTLLDDAALDRAVAEASGERLDPSRRAFARRLFARTVETPGGLKIQTIHAFCERILHLFPFEANVAAGFTVLDDIERAELLDRARRQTLARALQENGPLSDALELVAREASDASFDGLLGELLRHRGALGKACGSDYENKLRFDLGLSEADALASVEAEIIHAGIGCGGWRALAERLRQGSANDKKLGDQLARAAALAPDPACIEEYELLFFTQKGTPRGGDKSMITQGLCKSDPLLLPLLEEERDRLAGLLEKRKAAKTFERSRALSLIGQAIITEYERAKNLRGLFDFDDLIERTRELLRRSSPSWVLYKLDQQIDHILLDEAQDTSAPQWEILQAIAGEFAESRDGARRRSFFAVGDEKQSIFSFQGAAPEKFDAMRRNFQNRFAEAGLDFRLVPLTMSFRSAPTTLKAVDAIFAAGDNRHGLSFDKEEPAPEHHAWKSDLPGLVEIWDPIGAEKLEPPREWSLPLDRVSEQAPSLRLAGKVAAKIKALMAAGGGEWVEGDRGPRPVEAGDILILVRKRDAFFEAMIRALKEQGIAVAGADRLDLLDHIAVMDLCALARAALLQGDDLSLAELLKSPLAGLSDDDLLALAPGRSGPLADALAVATDPRLREAAESCEQWRRDARRLRPFDFFTRALGAGRGRERLIARLGPEANDAIDEFLRLALDFESDEPGGLTAFLASVEKLDVSIKRDMEAAGGAVRVMTVHASKGLEAKIVFMPDTCGAPTGRHDPKIFALGQGGEAGDASLAWSPKTDADCAAVARERERLREAARGEYQRLLYVALTRAEERLYVAAYHGEKAPAEGCWYLSIRNALEPSFESLPDPHDGERRILRSPAAPEPLSLPRGAAEERRIEIPAFARTPAPPEGSPMPPLRPSSALAGADVFTPYAAGAATKRDADRLLIGRLTHALLQHLPKCAPQKRSGAAQRFLQLRAPGLSGPLREEVARAAIRVIEDSLCAPLFGPGSAAEVDIVARLETPRGALDIAGRIDRLAVTESEVFVADFKTGRPREATSPAQLRQLALYRAAAARLYPEKTVRCVLIFTQDASLLEPPAEALDEALKEILERG
ncbi:double-strand break repair helicase AddA [Methylocystis heyeri]|uniref:DNA 3'-5' helicase n=1 Tax=Methylocystis heyeri TaxID=391905 RepID=A0A6B8KG31_9HYPH|nr:double-strand break repair helicase AddA [Methylocystis heyeri]QGM45951.1 double-strand break repair helicase AddA [Methylocystis heyeri]